MSWRVKILVACPWTSAGDSRLIDGLGIVSRRVKQTVVLLSASIQAAKSEQVGAALGDFVVWVQAMFADLVPANEFPASFRSHGVEPWANRESVANDSSVAAANETDPLGFFFWLFDVLGGLLALRFDLGVEGDLLLVGARNVDKRMVVE